MAQIVHLAEQFQTQAQNLEAEQSVLGSILINNRAFDQVRSVLMAKHFHEPSHGRIYEAIITEIDAGRSATAVELRAESFGLSRDYLANCVRHAVAVTDAASYATVVRECYIRRMVSQICIEANHRAANGEYLDAPADIIGDLRKGLADIDRDMLDDTTKPIGVVLDSLRARVEAKPIVMPTGLATIDNALDGGLHEGSLYAIEAPAGSFKTGTLGTIAMNMISRDVPMLFITVEMDSENIIARMVAAESRCNARHLMDASQCDQALGRISGFKDRHGYRKAYFAHRPGITIDGLAALCSAAVSKLGCKVIFIDYWQRIRGCRSSQSRAEFYESVADWTADFAATNGVAVVMASQLNRQGDSFGSGGIERAAAWIARLHKVEDEDRFSGQHEVLWLEVAKSRYSYSGNIGSETNPAFRIDGIGPVLKEIGDWARAAPPQDGVSQATSTPPAAEEG